MSLCYKLRCSRLLWSSVMVIVLAFTACAFAQNSSGTVSGRVVDQSGAAVSGATATLKSVEQGNERTVTSNAQGEYVFPQTAPGVYQLRVTAPKFETYIAKDLKVETDQSLHVDVSLVIGSVHVETIVDSAATTVNTQDAAVTVLIEKKLVEDIPLEAGNVVSLAALLPGVSDVNAPATFTRDTDGPTYVVSGARSNQNLFLLDGVVWNNLYTNTGLNFPPRQALQEVSVLLNNYKAQYGRNVGSIFNVITKAGSNTTHGQVWEYAQNTATNAADYFTQVNPKLIVNLFGATLGGPVVRDKLFYQLTYQQLRVAGTNIGNLFSPNLAERGLSPDGVTPLPCDPAGYFAGMTCASFVSDVNPARTPATTIINPLWAGTGSKGYAPLVQQMFNSAYTQAGGTLAPGQNSPCVQALDPANTHQTARYLSTPEIPSVCFNPVIKAMEARGYLPLPDHLNPAGQFITTTKAKLPRNDENIMLRLDYHPSSRHTIDARYYQQNANDHVAPGVATGSQAGGVLGNNTGNASYDIAYDTGKNRLGAIGDTFVLTPNMLNVVRLSYKRYTFVQSPGDHTTLADMGADLTLPGVPTLPYFGVSGRFTLGTQNEGYQNKVNGSIQFDDTLSWTRGRHQMMAGTEVLWLEYLNHTENPGELAYSSTYSGLNVSDFIQGLPETNLFSSPQILSGKQHDLYLFAQDDWRATQKLTVNLGLRYELPFQWYQPKGYSQTFIPGFQSTRYPTAPGGFAFYGDPGVRKSLVPTDYNGWQPRVGFAYDLRGNGKTSIRGGFGIFFDAVNADVVGAGQPFYYSFSITTPPGGTSIPLLGNSAIPTNSNAEHPVFAGPYNIFYPDRNFRTPYVMASNFGFQQQIGKSGTLEVNYVLRLGRKASIPVDQNPAIYDCKGAYFQADPATYCTGATATQASYNARARYPGFTESGNGVVALMSIGTSNYNALQMQFRERAGRSLTMLASYTYSRSLDISSTGTSLTNRVPNVDNVSSEYGPSDNNVKHNLTLGWSYRLPKITGSIAPVRAVLNNWSYSGIYSIRTGLPVNIISNGDPALTNEPLQRPSLMPGKNPLLPSNRHRSDKVKQWFRGQLSDVCNSASASPDCVWKIPGPGEVGTYSRNKMVGPGFTRIDMTVGRTFPLNQVRKGARFVFRVEAFNVFNTPNLNKPGNVISASSYANAGLITSTYGSNTVAGPIGRRMQLSGTLYF